MIDEASEAFGRAHGRDVLGQPNPKETWSAKKIEPFKGDPCQLSPAQQQGIFLLFGIARNHDLLYGGLTENQQHGFDEHVC